MAVPSWCTGHCAPVLCIGTRVLVGCLSDVPSGHGIAPMVFLAGLLAQGLGALVLARGGARPHHAPCCCSHGLHATHVVEPMCACSIAMPRCLLGAVKAHPWCAWCLSGLPLVCAWLVRGARTVLVWLAHGARAVLVWLAHGARAVIVWLARGERAVIVWLARGARAVLVWLARGARLAHPRCAPDSFVILTLSFKDLNHQPSRLPLLFNLKVLR
uniref:Uncharacterized protein n=1 Tax=Vitis vinifera TaxID=29760 RepID=A5BVZ4_VITVI|nr:hypothetical protein VITISV_028501 [Vitis vinifera]